LVQRHQGERRLFDVSLLDGATLWPLSLRRIDVLLEDDGLIRVLTGVQSKDARLCRGWPQQHVAAFVQ
jgi:hypothetical protein